MKTDDIDAVYDRLSESDDDLVYCQTDMRGRTWYTKRSEMAAMTMDEVDWLLKRGQQLMSFSTKDGIRWLTKEDTKRLYPNWGGHKD